MAEDHYNLAVGSDLPDICSECFFVFFLFTNAVRGDVKLFFKLNARRMGYLLFLFSYSYGLLDSL